MFNILLRESMYQGTWLWCLSISTFVDFNMKSLKAELRRALQDWLQPVGTRTSTLLNFVLVSITVWMERDPCSHEPKKLL